MREIKFRAWWECVKKMVFFDGPYIGYGSLGNWGLHFPAPGDLVFLGKSQLEQYTGKDDKNGRQIYEGDIVEQHGDPASRFPVSWDNEGLGFVMIGRHSEEPDFLGDYSDAYLEVVGNVHENPELVPAQPGRLE